jgi:hypothetical protein
VVTQEESSAPWAVLTGDTLFIGDVGRPDLSPRHTPKELAGLLYDSLHGKLLTLADSVLVYPAHGAGSLCGKNMRAERSSTIGTERLTNYALQIKSRKDFVAQLTSKLPVRPEYFLKDSEINRTGAAALADLPPLRGGHGVGVGGTSGADCRIGLTAGRGPAPAGARWYRSAWRVSGGWGCRLEEGGTSRGENFADHRQ